MLTSIATGCLSGNLTEKLHAVANAGFDGVQISESDILSYGGEPSEIGLLMRDLGLRCTALLSLRDFEGMPDDIRRHTLDRVERKFDVMADIGAELLVICSNTSAKALSDRDRIITDFRAIGDRASARGLRVGYEALAWGRYISDHRDAWAMIRDVDHTAVGLILGTFHSLCHNIPVETLRDIDPRKLFSIQIADAPQLTMDPLSWSRHFLNLPAQGDLPLVDYVAALAERGYDGPVSVEISNDRFRSEAASTIARDAKRSVVFLLDEVERKIRPDGNMVLPARTEVCGVAFIEFAASDQEAPRLAKLLGELGFAQIGHHRRKAVTRWKQGSINIVINSEVEGFAHSYDIVHGASVCAVGLEVVNVAKALERAQALNISVFRQPVGPNELEIPAIRGVGGSLIYLIDEGQCDNVWRHEFTAESNASGYTALTCVDHIAQSMHYNEMLSWVLYYISLFDVRKTQQLDIADPLGLVQSLAVESPNRRLRVTLNASASSRTAAGRFLHSYMGAGVQHIAFTTEDIFAAAEQMLGAGLELLTTPKNYYDHLEESFDLSSAQLARMAKYNIFYDRDDTGEYFQFYTKTFADNLFFEVVQRKGYDGYGAANAPVRLAAQAVPAVNFLL